MAELKATITADASSLISSARASEKALKGLTKTGAQLGSQIVRTFSAATKVAGQFTKAALAVGAALAGIAAVATKEFTDFESAFAQVQTLLVDATKGEIRVLREGIRRLSRTFGKDLVESTEAAYALISGGVTEPLAALSALEAALKAATGGASNVNQVVVALTKGLDAFGLGADQATRFLDALTAGVIKGQINLEGFAEQLPKVAGAASAAGLSFEDTIASLAAFTKFTGSSSQAATALRTVILGIVSPAKQAGVALEGIGVTADLLRREGLEEVFRRIGKETGGALDQVVRFLPGLRGIVPAAKLSGAGLRVLADSIQFVRERTGLLDRNLELVNRTLGQQFRIATATARDALVSLGEAISPLTVALLEPFQKFAENTRRELSGLAQFSKQNTDLLIDQFKRLGAEIDETEGAITLLGRGVRVVLREIGEALQSTSNEVAAIKIAFEGLLLGIKLTLQTGELLILGLVGLAKSAANEIRGLGAEIREFAIATQISLQAFNPERLTREGRRRLRDQADELRNEIDKIRGSVVRGNEDVAAFAERIRKAGDAFLKTRDQLLALDDKFSDLSENLRETGDQLVRSGVEAELAALRIGKAGTAIDQLGKAASFAVPELTELESLLLSAGIESESVSKKFEKMDKQLTKTSTVAKQTAAELKKVGESAAGLSDGFESEFVVLDGVFVSGGEELVNRFREITAQIGDGARGSLDIAIEAFKDGIISADEFAEALRRIQFELAKTRRQEEGARQIRAEAQQRSAGGRRRGGALIGGAGGAAGGFTGESFVVTSQGLVPTSAVAGQRLGEINVTQNIVIQATPGTDPRSLAREVGPELERRTRRGVQGASATT